MTAFEPQKRFEFEFEAKAEEFLLLLVLALSQFAHLCARWGNHPGACTITKQCS